MLTFKISISINALSVGIQEHEHSEEQYCWHTLVHFTNHDDSAGFACFLVFLRVFVDRLLGEERNQLEKEKKKKDHS